MRRLAAVALTLNSFGCDATRETDLPMWAIGVAAVAVVTLLLRLK